MTSAQTAEAPPSQSDKTMTEKPLRVWPGLALAAALLAGIFVLPAVAPKATLAGLLVAFVATLGLLVWWAFFSRVPRLERWGALALTAAAVFAARKLVHVSVAGAGMGILFPVYAVMTVSVALVAATLIGRRLSTVARR